MSSKVFVLFIGVASILVGAIATGLLRWYAVKLDVVDRPTDRSSHEIPTPRGGGLSLVVVFVCLLITLFAGAEIPGRHFAALLAGSLLVSGIGFVDDHRHVAASYRFFVHVLAAVLAVFLVGGLPPLPIGAMAVDLSWAGDVLAVVFLVWLTNLYNFMDGIDGIAAVETIFVAGAAAAIAYTGDTHFILVLEIGIAAACIGFLIWNWPPAKIFMGDVGSGFVGFALGALAIVSAQQGLLPIWTWLILAGVFVADATVTVIRRMARGERWYEAHRSHAYQRLARRHGNHRSVTLLVCAVNLAWLLPIAAASASWPDLGWMLTIVAWLPLLVAAAFLGAGLPDEERVTATDSQRQNTL